MPDRLSAVERIEKDFRYYSPTEEKTPEYVSIRAKAKQLALLIAELTPESREQSLAITNLEQAVFWANAAIARSPDE